VALENTGVDSTTREPFARVRIDAHHHAMVLTD
jgi:hypothetical protein